jgi:hypothetical protein
MGTGVTDRQRSTDELLGLIRQADVVFGDVLPKVAPEHRKTDLAPDLCEAPLSIARQRLGGWDRSLTPCKEERQ